MYYNVRCNVIQRYLPKQCRNILYELDPIQGLYENDVGPNARLHKGRYKAFHSLKGQRPLRREHHERGGHAGLVRGIGRRYIYIYIL